MAGPPDNIPPSETFQRLLERPRPGEIVPFPGLDEPGARGELRIEVLKNEEHHRARLIARDRLKKNAKRYGITSLTEQDMQSDAVRGVEADLAACEVLAMACKQVKPFTGEDEDRERVNYPRVFADGEAVAQVLTSDEVAYLYSALTIIQSKYGPNEATCLPEDVNAWVRRLVEGAADYPFLRLSSPQWAELLTALARKLYDLSSLLESQLSELPESLRSDLETYCLGTGSAGEPAEYSSAALPGPGAELSFEQALRMTNLIKPKTPED